MLFIEYGFYVRFLKKYSAVANDSGVPMSINLIPIWYPHNPLPTKVGKNCFSSEYSLPSGTVFKTSFFIRYTPALIQPEPNVSPSVIVDCSRKKPFSSVMVQDSFLRCIMVQYSINSRQNRHNFACDTSKYLFFQEFKQKLFKMITLIAQKW